MVTLPPPEESLMSSESKGVNVRGLPACRHEDPESFFLFFLFSEGVPSFFKARIVLCSMQPWLQGLCLMRLQRHGNCISFIMYVFKFRSFRRLFLVKSMYVDNVCLYALSRLFFICIYIYIYGAHIYI